MHIDKQLKYFAVTIAEDIHKRKVKRILQQKTNFFHKIGLGKINWLHKDTFTPSVGKHKIPKYLYHLTTEENYQAILKSNKLKRGGKYEQIQGVFMFELSNFFKRWGTSPIWQGKNLRNSLINQSRHGGYGKLVLLRIPTENLNREKLLVRSQNKLFSCIHNPKYYTFLRDLKSADIIPDELTHSFNGDSARKSKLYKQRKEAIEYIYPKAINISKIQKVGESNSVNFFGNTLNVYTVFSNLLKGTPEEKALRLFKN